MKTPTQNQTNAKNQIIDSFKAVFIYGNASKIQQLTVYIPIVIILTACVLIFGHAPKY